MLAVAILLVELSCGHTNRQTDADERFTPATVVGVRSKYDAGNTKRGVHCTVSHAVTRTDVLQVAETDSDDDNVDDKQERASTLSPPTDEADTCEVCLIK